MHHILHHAVYSLIPTYHGPHFSYLTSYLYVRGAPLLMCLTMPVSGLEQGIFKYPAGSKKIMTTQQLHVSDCVMYVMGGQQL